MPQSFTNTQLQKISIGLASLDGLRTSPDSFEPFQFSPDTIWAIASNQSIIAEKLALFDKAKKALAAQYKITDRMSITPENSESVAAFVAGLDELNDREISVEGLEKISRDKLNVGSDPKKNQNRISPSVLVNLMPILE